MNAVTTNQIRPIPIVQYRLRIPVVPGRLDEGILYEFSLVQLANRGFRDRAMPVQAASLLLCNYVYDDPISRNLTLLGIFTSLRATKFPTPYRSMMVYALLIGDPGESGELKLECVADATQAACGEDRLRVTIGEQGKRHIRLWLDGVRFPTRGLYHFRLSFDDEPIAELTIPVEGVSDD